MALTNYMQFKGQKPKIVESQIAPAEFKRGETEVSIAASPNLKTTVDIELEPNPLIAQPAVFHGFAVRRWFAAATPAAKVWKDAEGVWHAKLGSKVKAMVAFVPERLINHCVLDDYFGGGFAVTAKDLPIANYNAPMDKYSLNDVSYTDGWHQQAKVELTHVNVLASEIEASQYIFTYSMLAANPGNFYIPSAYLSDPYDRTCFGCSASDRFIIEP